MKRLEMENYNTILEQAKFTYFPLRKALKLKQYHCLDYRLK